MVPVVDWLVGFVIERVPRAKARSSPASPSLFAPRLETPSPRPIAVSAPSSVHDRRDPAHELAVLGRVGVVQIESEVDLPIPPSSRALPHPFGM